MKWIVLSDLHMQFKNCKTNTARRKLLDALFREKDEGDISFILITGDCMHQHKGNLDNIKDFIMQIADACGVAREKIFMCPGNHDINRNNSERKRAINQYRQKDNFPALETCLDGYDRFNALYNSVKGNFYKPFVYETVDDFRIITIDTCLLSMDDRDSGQLAVGFPELSDLSDEISKDDKITEDDKINIVIMHHGVEWLKPEDARSFQHWLSDNHVSMVFCGHNHAVGVNVLTEAIQNGDIPRHGILQFTCGAAFYDSYSKPTFLVGEYLEDNSVNIKLYEYRNNSEWEVASGILRSFPQGRFEQMSQRQYMKNIWDVPKIYNTIFDADSDIASELQTSSKVTFFGLRGKTFLKGGSKIANALSEKRKSILCRILVSDPYNKYIEKRLRNVPDFSQQANLERQWKAIYEDIKRLRDYMPDLEKGSIRYHEQPLLFRFIMTDKAVYFGYYAREVSSKSAMYRYSNQSSLYSALTDYFDNAWACANTKFDTKIPDRCSFLEDRFTMQPSLVINLTDACNMRCRYCPEGGESLKKCSELCGIDQIKYLLTAYAAYCRRKQWQEKKVLRITGGEPLLVSDRLHEVLTHAKSVGFQKIVLCTNGTHLKKCYDEKPEIWEAVKEILLLKISLDSLKQDTFKELTRCDDLDLVLKNISFARSHGFKIELNMVATRDNVLEIEDIYNYAYDNRLVGVKVLTINDFGGRVEQDNVENELAAIINWMREKNYIETGLYVHNNEGIHMKRFIHDACTLTIVDHMNNTDSITPRRTYSEKCESCYYYPTSIQVKRDIKTPCATGIMSLSMRADGMLSFCRLRSNEGEMLNNKGEDEVAKSVERQLSSFEHCYHYEVGE